MLLLMMLLLLLLIRLLLLLLLLLLFSRMPSWASIGGARWALIVCVLCWGPYDWRQLKRLLLCLGSLWQMRSVEFGPFGCLVFTQWKSWQSSKSEALDRLSTDLGRTREEREERLEGGGRP